MLLVLSLFVLILTSTSYLFGFFHERKRDDGSHNYYCYYYYYDYYNCWYLIAKEVLVLTCSG